MEARSAHPRPPRPDRSRSLMLTQINTAMLHDPGNFLIFLGELLLAVFAVPGIIFQVSHLTTMILFTFWAVYRFKDYILPTKEQLESQLTDQELQDIDEPDRNAYYYRIFILFRLITNPTKAVQIWVNDIVPSTRIEDTIRYNFKSIFGLLAIILLSFLYARPAVDALNILYYLPDSFSNFLVTNHVKPEFAAYVAPMFFSVALYASRSLIIGVGALLYKLPCILKPVVESIASGLRRLRNCCYPGLSQEFRPLPREEQQPRRESEADIRDSLAAAGADQSAVASAAYQGNGAGLGLDVTARKDEFYECGSSEYAHTFFSCKYRPSVNRAPVAIAGIHHTTT